MSVPTQQLRELYLSGGMPPHTRSQSESDLVRKRATHIRDILSSFKVDCLPSEYKPDIFQKITRATSLGTEPRSQVTPLDLEASLFGLGAHDQEFFDQLCKLQSDDFLNRFYCEELGRRFEALFSDYDKLSPTSQHRNLLGEVTETIEKLWGYYRNAVADREERRARELKDPELARKIDSRFASMLITQLHALCQRSRVKPESPSADEPAPKKQKSSSSRGGQVPRSPRKAPTAKSYLFEHILGNALTPTEFFALEILERCSAESLSELQPGLRALQAQLESEGASQGYQNRFEKLVTPEEEEEEEEE